MLSYSRPAVWVRIEESRLLFLTNKRLLNIYAAPLKTTFCLVFIPYSIYKEHSSDQDSSSYRVGHDSNKTQVVNWWDQWQCFLTIFTWCVDKSYVMSCGKDDRRLKVVCDEIGAFQQPAVHMIKSPYFIVEKYNKRLYDMNRMNNHYFVPLYMFLWEMVVIYS